MKSIKCDKCNLTIYCKNNLAEKTLNLHKIYGSCNKYLKGVKELKELLTIYGVSKHWIYKI